MTNAHQTQFWLTPPVRTRSVTKLGVSAEKVVATIDVPINHQGMERPARKYSSVPRPARRAKANPTLRIVTPYNARTHQSSAESCI